MTRGRNGSCYSELIAKEMITGGSFERLRWAALLHDMGKLDVPPEILNKDDDRPTRRPSSHAIREGRALPGADRRLAGRMATRSRRPSRALGWNGISARPRGTDIPLAARIVAVADAYDVMTSTRSYKKPMPPRSPGGRSPTTPVRSSTRRSPEPSSPSASATSGVPAGRWPGRQPPGDSTGPDRLGDPTDRIGIVATATTMSAAVVNLPEEPPRQPQPSPSSTRPPRRFLRPRRPSSRPRRYQPPLLRRRRRPPRRQQ